LAVALARAGAGKVLGFDIKPERIAALEAGQDRTGEVAAADLTAALQDGLAVTGDGARLRDQEIYIVTVPTPVDDANQPDLTPLEAACRTIGRALAGGSATSAPPIVVFESTVYPGVTEDICGPTIEAASGKRAGRDFFLGYSPERINPGDRSRTVDRIAKVVAGQTPAVAERLAALYGRITRGGTFIARDIRTAEAAKAIENAQRDINIAFINEVTMIVGRLGLSVYDVLEAARTKWNFLDFRPGLVGGHCIPVDPFYLAACAQAVGHEPEVILAGRRINDGMGGYFAGRIAEAGGNAAGRAPRTLVLGLTFKENLPDLRNSKVIDLIRGLEARGHRVSVHDPHADPAEAQAMYGLSLLTDLPKRNGGARFDVVVAAVPHEAYRAFTAEDIGRLLDAKGLVADIKGIWRELALPEGVRRWQP
ncbi:MAG TPA: nucleotide sugar dehydrogenase, partial [Stellaceae bacterium]|nr:nucleotide sugar dehydrogenase [Stellaceae bacterium]